jgi:hypothetical protein
MVGVAMGFMASAPEAVLRSVRKGTTKPRAVVEPPTGTIKGSDVEGPLGG